MTICQASASNTTWTWSLNPALSSAAKVVACAALAGIAPLAAAHPDDPKIRDRQARFEGPGYRAAMQFAGDPAFSSSGVSLQSWITVPEFGNADGGNDCWGYVSPSGREYALMGLSNATSVVEVTNPANAQIIQTIPGPNSMWRDVKVYDEYAYVVTEGSGSGIQVLDLTNVDNGVVTLANTINTGGTTSSHNVVIDETSGFLYRVGGGTNLGLRIYDLSNPANPVFVNDWTDLYIHDAQVVTYTSGPLAGQQIAYCCSGEGNGFGNTGLSVLNVTNKNNIVELDRVFYPNSAYSHQIWLTEDLQYAYLNDELDEDGSLSTTTFIFDVSNPSNVQFDGTFDNGNTAVGHNLYVRGDLLYEANYRSGLRIFDISDRESPVEIGFFDTYPGDDAANFNGLWSVYPFFPSGTVIGSDIERGLFVWTVGVGQVAIDLPSGAPDLVSTNGESLTFTVDELVDGAFDPSSPALSYRLEGTPTYTSVSMSNVGGNQWSASLPSVPCGMAIEWYASIESTDGFTTYFPATAPAIGATSIGGDSAELNYEYTSQTSAGWVVDNIDLLDGGWDRGIPAGDGLRGDPTVDFDGSGAAWLTDNVIGNSDVDGGPTRLTSPIISLTGVGVDQARLSFAAWFTNDDGDGDRLSVEISANNGTTWSPVDEFAGGSGWRAQSYALSSLVPAGTSSIRLRFDATDNPNDSVTEAGIDGIRIQTYVCGSAVPGDVNGDGVVDFADLVGLLGSWGVCLVGEPCPADIDGNGSVDFGDLVALLALL